MENKVYKSVLEYIKNNKINNFATLCDNLKTTDNLSTTGRKFRAIIENPTFFKTYFDSLNLK
ncbi:hypothetical protein AVBRAN12640_07795 [Campylobacter sp. RM12640]|uniref:hypothetical protein n=1 Tax=unclassified Campylobacter TaxID=2593542 RepID=UPI001D557362|nr:hypothetical protein [Campylobacter sp. RM12642]MBZ7982436.1 hypothetical protein [Campylobacter sp. RM12640]MBZ7990058.1 hypothetical protein [Campylobacter sp. RM12635]MBZ8008246.1 hypothetical protein [Campylobacter sp. RM9334]